MAYRFKRKESIAAGFARIAGEQIAAAVEALAKSPNKGVHEARRCIKRLRALLRLFRRALPDGSYERENTALRNAAQNLSDSRDAQARLIAFDSVARNVKLPGIAKARRDFVTSVKTSVGANGSPAQSTITALRTLGARLPGLKPDSGWSVLRRGLKATYRRARNAHADAHAELTTDAIHRWRRRSKDFGYHLQLLRKIDPPEMKRSIRTAHQLSELLGEDHDLAILDQALAVASHLSTELREKLASRIARRRKKLQRRAFKIGSELYFEKPVVVIQSLAKSWKAWRRTGNK